MCDAIVDATGFGSGFVVLDIDGSGICDGGRGGAWMPFDKEASVVGVVSEKK
jgi:hypothetical protein